MERMAFEKRLFGPESLDHLRTHYLLRFILACKRAQRGPLRDALCVSMCAL